MYSRSLVALSISALCLTACGRDPEVAKREYVKSGDEYVAAGKLNEASIQYRNAIQQDLRFGEARLKLAETLAKIGDMRGAYQQYVRAADLMPTNVDAQVKAGTMVLLARQFDDAKSRAEKVIASAPDNIDARILLANSLAGKKDMKAAIAAMQAAIAIDPLRSLSYSNLGVIQMMAGQAAPAEQSHLKAVQVDAKSVRARTELAAFYWRGGQRARAEGLLQEALSLDPKDLVANRFLASVYLSTNRVPQAEAPLKTIAEASKDVASQVLLADYYSSARRVPDALAVLDALERDPKGFVPAMTRKSVLLYGQGQKAEGHGAVEAALAKEPKNIEALLVKADLLAAERKLREALTVAETAASADSNAVAAHFAVGRLRRSLGQTEGAIAAFNEVLRLNPKTVAAQLEISRAYLSAGRPQDTLQFAQDVLNAQPRNPDALLLQARGLMGIGDVKAAERPTSALVRDYPSMPVVQVQLGDLYRQKGNSAGARSAYARALEIDPLNLEALSGLTALDLQQGRGVDARARLEAALAQRSDSSALLLLAGRLYAQLQDYPQAERTFRRVIEIDPGNAEVYGLLGRYYQTQGRIDQAIAEFDRLAARTPKPVGVHTLIGTLLETQNRVDEAKQRYQQALNIERDAPIAANNLAWLLAEHGGNLDVALQLAQAARARLPESAAVADTLGWIFYKKGLFDQAAAAFKDSVSREPQVAAFQYHLGLSSAKRGDAALAKTSLKKALTLDPKAHEAEEARAELARLAESRS